MGATTTATLYYLKDTNTELYTRVYKSEPGEEAKENFSNLERLETNVELEDLRPKAEEFTLKRNGFTLTNLDPPEINWEDKAQVLQLFINLRTFNASPAVRKKSTTHQFHRIMLL